ncbi:forkhead box protein B2-like [Penaeus monodon]|uniref:forkhead box protein B2-like n=1 Tax=Penaeus monodon TaxID=6687 RepID=UPI0018A70387|nr:forkhead box protein B2-like [Penaeus monodon]
MAAAVSEVNLKPRQVTRLRREEEEESWISGEELYTEGSSEDEGASSSSSAHAHAHAHTQAHTHSHAHAHAHAHARHIPQADHKRTCPVPPHSPPTTPPSAASEPAQQDDPHLTETTRRLSQMGLDQSTDSSGAMGGTGTEGDEVEEQEEVMLWRPKRGSIKLPHVDLDPPAPLLEQVSG